MKNKYQRMDRSSKKALYKKFMKTDQGKENMNRLYRILVYGVAAIAYSIFRLVYLINDFKVWNLILCILFIIFGLIFIISFFKLRIKELNNFALKQK